MPVTIYKRKEIWHYRGTVAGRRVRGSCGTADKAIAQRIAAEVERAVWNRRFDGPGANLTMAGAIDAYVDSGKPTRFLAAINAYWRDTPIAGITAGAVAASARKMFPGCAPATWNRQAIVPAQAVINHAAGLGWCHPIRVKRFKVDAKTKAPATFEWVEAFARQARADGLPHHAALALFMFGTGARVGEATALQWADVDLSACQATIRQTKVGNTRVAHLHVAVVAALANVGGERDPALQVFCLARADSVNKAWRNIAARAGIADLTPHCCRHGFATAMLRAGYDVKTVAHAGGWKDAGTVLRTYAHAIEDRTITNAIFDTPLTQRVSENGITHYQQKEKKQ